MSVRMRGYIVIIASFIILFTNGLVNGASGISDWYEDANGYSKVYDIAKREKRPLIVYFHVEWCGYCQHLNKEFLGDNDVDEFISNYLRVRINPEDGKMERKISEKYGVKGYPAFLITYPSGNKVKKVHPFKKGGKIWSTGKFIDEIKIAIENTSK